jgi:thiamine-monophosphate kinase
MRESNLLQHIYAHRERLTDRITIPPGDDMGAIRFGDGQLLVAVDQIADGVHVNSANTPLDLIARKAIVRNLSDVAAMAALPVGAVASACLPRSWDEAKAQELIDALRSHAAAFHCPMIGGDLTIWDQPLVISVTVFAEAAGVEPIRRGGAVEGDDIYVTGELGGAWDEQGGGPHLHAELRIGVARALATNKALHLHSMIDLSDGLASDLPRICEASNVGAAIDASAIPARQGVTLESALCDGEDYELCFTCKGPVPDQIEGVPITRIGQIVSAEGANAPVQIHHADGRIEPLRATGWDHGGHE